MAHLRADTEAFDIRRSWRQLHVDFAGLRGSLAQLHASGWQITSTLQHEPCHMTTHVELALRYRHLPYGQGLIFVAHVHEEYFMPNSLIYNHPYPVTVPVRRICNDIDRVDVHELDVLTNGLPARTSPQTQRQTLTAFDFYGFNEEKTETGIIISADNIDEVLHLVKKVQAPNQAEIRERVRRRESELTITAEIFSFG